MTKYLEEMEDEELIAIAKEEKNFLGLTFNKEKIIENLEKKGYKRKNDNIVQYEEKTEIILTEMREDIKVDAVEEIDLLFEGSYRYRSRNYYRNYPNKKLMRKLKKRYRFKNRKDKELFFNYREITKEEIRKREIETEINKSKFSKGAEYEGEPQIEDIFFDKAPLPESYFVDEVVLMPKNPTTLFVYWEIREDTFTHLSKNNNDIVDNIVIKLFKDGYEYRKIIRHERMGSHYIGDVDTDENYEAFVGYEDKYGNFSEVAHSNITAVPSDKLSNNLDLLWGTVKEDDNTNQIIKYINSPIPTPENVEFLELSRTPINNEDDEFVVEVLERLLKVGASENLIEREVRKIKPDRLIMTGIRSS